MSWTTPQSQTNRHGWSPTRWPMSILTRSQYKFYIMAWAPFLLSYLKSWCHQLLQRHSTLRWQVPVPRKESWVYSILSTSEEISGLGGQTVKGKCFLQSSHKTETKRTIWNRKQWPLWHDSQRESQRQGLRKANVQSPRELQLTLNISHQAS